MVSPDFTPSEGAPGPVVCRLLLMHNPAGLDPNPPLDEFRYLSRESREYQGHGWGCAWLDVEGNWKFHRDIRPVWEDDRSDFPDTTLFLGHARSAFRNEGICVDNNMPFSDGRSVFVFNGELQGVRVRAEGRIGAEKIYNYVRRFDRGNMSDAIRRAVDILEKRTRYVRAMNFMLATEDAIHVCSLFNEDPEYFQMQKSVVDGTLILSSERFRGDRSKDWMPVENRTFLDFPLQVGGTC